MKPQITWISERRKVADLIPWEKNPRQLTDKQAKALSKSLTKFGVAAPIIINANNHIIGGHQRVSLLKRDGVTEVDVRVASRLLDDEEEQELNIRLNKNTGEFDWDALANSFDPDFLKEVGFDEKELDRILGKKEAAEDDFDAEAELESIKEPITKPGDIWQLGRHRVMCGDSTKGEDVERLMEGKKAEICFTSPPYSDQRDYLGGEDLSVEHLAEFITAANESVSYFVVNLGYSRKDGEVNTYWDTYITGARASGLKLLSWNVWDRSGFGYTVGQATAMFAIDHEWIFVFGKERKDLNRTIENKQSGQSKKGTNRQKDGSTTAKQNTVLGHRQLGTIISGDYARFVGQEQSHPATFPVYLPSEYILAMTSSGEGVYDPFLGSASTLIACEQTGRTCYGMEISPAYVDVSIARYEKLTGQKAEKLV